MGDKETESVSRGDEQSSDLPNVMAQRMKLLKKRKGKLSSLRSGKKRKQQKWK